MTGGEKILTVRAPPATASDVPPTEGARSGNHVREGEQVVSIDICDTGSGLSNENLLKVFDAFYTTKPPDSATGLGLTVARETIRLHGGILTLEDRNDCSGLRVTISLRRADSFRTLV